MSFEFLDPIIQVLPEVKKPAVKPPFNKRIMWVAAGLTIFFILGMVTPYGVLTGSRLEQIKTTNPGLYNQTRAMEQRVAFLQEVQTVLASNMGTLGTLGIGPIVMASIILQLLSGAELIEIEKERYQGVQKLAAVLFCFFEGAIYVYTGFLPVMPSASLLPIAGLSALFELNKLLVMFQIAMGSIVLLYLDEVITKYGFGSGIGLFIAAGVSKNIVWNSLSPLRSGGEYGAFIGNIPQLLNDFIQSGFINIDLLLPIVFTIAVFLIVVYLESMRIEVPLTLGRIRGVGGRYPLKFLYASNLPVILAAALFANVQLFANVFYGFGYPLLGTFSSAGGQGSAPSAEFALGNFTSFSLQGAQTFLQGTTIPIAYYVRAPYSIIGTTANIQDYIVTPLTLFFQGQGAIPQELIHLVVYAIIMVIVCIIFGKFWIETTGMDSKKVAEQLRNVGFSVPGFRRDARVIERVLDRYIPVITVLGSASVGLLAAGADVTGAFGSGTGILLTVGILYRLYEELAQSQLMEMHPALKNFLST
jgi:preprotein translocase subunit SecY